MTAPAQGHPVIAIVDDDVSIRVALGRLTRSLGYPAQVFPAAEPLLASLTDAAFGLVITDVQMPTISGLDLLRILSERAPDLPVLVMTAYPSAATHARALALGAVACLAKPFEAEQFETCLKQALGDRRTLC